MNLITKRIGLFVFLIFGLVSCGSENTKEIVRTVETEAPSEEPLSVQYGHPDKSVHKIQDSKTLSVTSKVELESQDGSPSSEIQADIECRRPPLTTIFRKQMTLRNKDAIEMSEIVPSEAFYINPKGGDTLSCIVYLDVESQEGTQSRIELKTLEISNFNSFSNSQPLDNFEIQPQQDFMYHQLENRNIRSLAESENIVLSCENGSRLLDHQTPHKNFQQFFAGSEDMNSPRQKCRMVISDTEDLSVNKISPAFYINQPLRPLKLTEKHYFKVTSPKSILIDHPFATYEFTNPNDSPVFVRFHGSTSRFTIEESFLVGINPVPRGGVPRRALISWSVEGDVEIHLQEGDTWLVAVPGGKQIRFVGKGSLAHDCTEYISTPGNQCQSKPRLYGIRSLWEQLPVVTQNRFNTFASWDFQTLLNENSEGRFKERKYQGYSHWSPMNHQGCSSKNEGQYLDIGPPIEWPHRCAPH